MGETGRRRRDRTGTATATTTAGNAKVGGPERWGNITLPEVPASPVLLVGMTSE